MIIKTIKLQNFRIHEKYKLNCQKKTSLIVGENGCGKTSVLEAIYIMLQGKSFRAVDREIIQRGRKFYRIELEYQNGEKNIMVYDGVRKNFIIKDRKFVRLPKKNRYPVILFKPDDLNLIGASPVRRRDYFDKFFSQLDQSYNNSLLKYNKVLKQRNELLKQNYVKKELIFSWDILLAQYGVDLILKRRKYITEINQLITKTYRSIANNQDEVEILYQNNYKETESEYLKKLEDSLEKDRFLGYTSFGIHRDNYEFIFNQVLADGSASRGEVRSLILALKFIEAEFLTKYLNKKPVILLDDVFSELDEVRQKCLVKNFKNNQVIITSVDEI